MRALSRRRALAAALAALSLAVPAVAHAATPASDGPGALSHFDLARKDCLGTARDDTSKVGSRSPTAC